MATQNREFARKVTIATFAHKTRIVQALLDWERDPKTKGTEMPLCRIIGSASNYLVGVNKQTAQEFVKYQGTFRVTDLVPDGDGPTGEEADAGTCILPDFLNGPLMTAMKMGAEGGKLNQVTFGFAIGAIYNATAITGYEFKTRSLIPMRPENDPLLHLEVAMGLKDASALQLEAPSTPAANMSQIEEAQVATQASKAVKKVLATTKAAGRRR